MKFVQAVPDEPYFHWQLWAQMANFRLFRLQNGQTYEENAIIAVGIKNPEPTPEMLHFVAWTKAKVVFIPDTRPPNNYVSTIRPHLLKKLWLHMPELENEHIFYHDSDIVFTAPLDDVALAEGDLSYVGDTRSYIGAEYLKRFTNWQFYAMCDLIGLKPDEVVSRETGSGGAQYYIKNVDVAYWAKVEKDCLNLYNFLEEATSNGLRRFNPHAPVTKYHITVWCADMWAVLWNLWFVGKETAIHPDLNFAWPFHSTKDCQDTFKIIHNAGIDGNNWKNQEGKPHLFYKGHYLGHYPYGDDLDFVKKDTASYIYTQYIKNAHIFRRQTINQDKPMKILAIACTTNRVHPHILRKHYESIQAAVKHTTLAEVKVTTISWEKAEWNPFENYIIPFQGLGHLNYILQIKKGMVLNPGYDVVCFLEHDVLYPPQYFDEITREWSYGHYGLSYDNYEGARPTGWQLVRERHQPMSLLALSWGFTWDLLNRKIDEFLYRYEATPEPSWPLGWCCIEPDDKSTIKRVPYTAFQPAIHLNTFGTSYTHHLTGHGDFCYEPEPWTTLHPYWGDVKQYFPQ